MTKVTFISTRFGRRECDLVIGRSLMEGARRNGIQEIVAECGGASVCATCHCYIDEAWISKLGAQSDVEQMLLEMASDVQPNSRLSCQIPITAELEGLIVYLPAVE